MIKEKIKKVIDDAFEADAYKQYADITASSFGKPIWYWWKKNHPDTDLEFEPKSIMGWYSAMVGTSLHKRLEDADTTIENVQKETQKIIEYNGYKVGGTADLIVDGYVCDLKTKNQWVFQNGYEKPVSDMNVWQLSLLNYIFDLNKDYGFIIEIPRDMTKKAEEEIGDYKLVKKVKLKSYKKVERRLNAIISAFRQEPDDDCTTVDCTYCDAMCINSKKVI